MDTKKAGRMGGNVVKERYGPEFYAEMGKKGGEALRDRYGHDHYVELGRKGAAARAKNAAKRKRLAKKEEKASA
jgi:general stress protein YciG